MNNEVKKPKLLDAVAAALRAVEREHGVRIVQLSAEWLDMTSMHEQRHELKTLHIEAARADA